ncbi:MAG: hypothetical protein M1826_001872 [Phylliscum demangeonii]|nr:MAG: hypothetical protein M1826_001872 [Phylliscum demangeonii]
MSALVAELAKPVSSSDEVGYIYMFCLTDGTAESSPPSVLNRSKDRISSRTRVQELSIPESFPASGDAKRSVLLKIGRTSNVFRRLNEWNRQCGYELTLLRFYPHQSSRPTPPCKVMHVRRVERLIHLELAEKRVTQACQACGQTHREWFSVEATSEGVRVVDRAITRWIDWAGALPRLSARVG